MEDDKHAYIFYIKLSRYAMHALREREREDRSYSFLTSALDGGDGSASHPGRALSPGKEPRHPLCRKLGGPQSLSGNRG
jgi:hypothetical protein